MASLKLLAEWVLSAKGCLLCLFFAAALAVSGDSPQQNPGATDTSNLKGLSLEELSQIEVTTPSKTPERAFQTAAAISVLTSEDIRRSGATSIPEALRMVPGVEVARIDGSKWSIGIRGFGSRLTRAVLVLIDGRTVYTSLVAGTYWEVQDTLLEDVERIEVIRGPGGTIWGPNAVNGVINIITKDSAETKGTLVSVGGGSDIQGFFNFRYGGGNSKDFSYRVYGKGSTDGPELHSDHRNYDDWRSAQTGFRMDWHEGQRDSITLEGDLYRQIDGERVTATTYAPPFSQIVDANARLSGGNINARWHRDFSDGNDFQLQIYYDRTNRYEPNLTDLRSTFDVDFLDRFRLPGRQQIAWGLGARIIPINDPEVVSGLTFLPENRTDYLATGFLEDAIGLVDQRLSLTLGTKILRTNFTGVKLEPSVQLLWTPTKKQTVWAAFTHALRTPSDAEENFNLSGFVGTASDGTPFFARFNANPNFVSEQLNGYEIGFRQLITSKISIDTSGFYNHYHDLFDEELAGSTFLEASPAPAHLLLPAQFRNGLRGATKGVEISPEWRPLESWRLRGSYSYLHMDLDRSPGSGDIGTAPNIEASSPNHEITAQSSVDLPHNFQWDLNFRYVSELPTSVQPIPAYSTLDARLGWRFRHFDLSVVGRNLLQPSHYEFSSDPGPTVAIRRSAYIKLTWSR